MEGCLNFRFDYLLGFILDKPKCFFINACRGGDVQPAVPNDGLETDNRNPAKRRHKKKPEEITIPIDANVLLVYATTPGTLYTFGRDFGIMQIWAQNLKQHNVML